MTDLNRKPINPAGMSATARITLIYFIIGALWIFSSDYILSLLVSNVETIKWISIYKGWLFVLVTGILLFLLMKRAESARDELQAELVKSERKYRSIVETFNEVVWTFDEEGKITFINGACRRHFGYGPEEMTGKIFLQYVAPECKQRDMEYFAGAVSGGRDIVDYETKIIDNLGNVKNVIVNAVIAKDAAGKKTAIYGTIFDVTEQKRYEEALVASEEKYRKLVESSHGLVWTFDKNFNITFVNQPSNEILGYKPDELIGKNIYSISDPVYAHRNMAIITQVIKLRKSKAQFESALKAKDGRQVFFLVNLLLEYDSGGNFTGSISKSLDITERKKIEEQVRISEEKYRNIVETANEGVWITDKENKTTFVNRALAKMLGYEVREMLGRLIYEFIDTSGASETGTGILMDNRSNASIYELKFLKKNGETLWILLNTTPIFDKDENFDGTLAMLTDINGRKLALDALAASENRYRTVLDTSPSSIRIIDLNGKILYGNRRTAVLHGYNDISEMIGMSVFELMKGENEVISRNSLQAVKDKGFASGEIYFARKDGSEFPAEFYSSMLNDESDRPIGFISIINDISEKKKAQQEVLESRERLSSILNTAMDAIVTTDESRKIVLFNKSAEKLFKCSESAALGSDVNKFIPERFQKIHNRHVEKFSQTAETFSSMLSGSSPVAITLDGEEIPVETSVSKTEIGGMKFYTVILRDITERIRYETDLKDSNSKLHHLASHLQNIREEERMLISRDIHDQVGQELTALKMDMVMLSKELERNGAPSDGKKVIEELRSMADLTDKSIKWIRNLSTELRPDVLDRLGLFEAVEWHCKEFEKRSGIGCKVRLNGNDSDLSKEHSVVFFRILQESLTNVLRHSGASGVEVNMTESGDDFTLMVKDNGKGITEERLEGTASLGLIGMKERAYMLGGAVEVCGNEGKGAIIKAVIPKINKSYHE